MCARWNGSRLLYERPASSITGVSVAGPSSVIPPPATTSSAVSIDSEVMRFGFPRVRALWRRMPARARCFKLRQGLANADEPFGAHGEIGILCHALFEKPDNVVIGVTWIMPDHQIVVGRGI